MLPEHMRDEIKMPFPKDVDYIKSLLGVYRRSMEENSEIIAPARSIVEVERNAAAGKMSGILSLEDGRAVEGKMENLEWLYQEGVRMIALTWNYENCFGFPNSRDQEIMNKGLKDFGKDAILCMNELGMAIDVSHLNDGGFWDVVKISEKPFIASHANCRAIAPHQRNLTDGMIRALAEKGGVMGVNWCGPFLNEDAKCRESRIGQIVKHLKHMVNVGGIETAAIGTDFDGTFGNFDIPECSKMQRLFEAMGKSGFSTEEIEKIAYKNVKRAMRDIIG
jgi:membrane dipeptidase